jgi:hypothetical protein
MIELDRPRCDSPQMEDNLNEFADRSAGVIAMSEMGNA